MLDARDQRALKFGCRSRTCLASPENESGGFAQSTRFLSLEAAVDPGGWLHLRAGYRRNLAEDARDVRSVGLGVSRSGTGHLGVAVARNDNEAGLAAGIALTL